MKDTKFDRKKVIEEMEALKSKRIYEIKKDIIGRDELEADENALNKAVTIKYLGKMEFINEQGELVDKDVFISVEEHSGQFQIRYYDEDQKLLGIQRAFDENIIPSGDMIDKLPEEMNKLEKQDIEEAKTLEELKEEQNQEEQQTEEKQQAQQEPQKLPGTEDEAPQLNKTDKKILLNGDLPSPADLPKGCKFHTRCSYVMEKCKNCIPQERGASHKVKCFLYE